ncbi:uncharacterized protein LOC123004013 isoform X2 [Tribolium madens]|nr:uncharacterized protein LOC123004013 isoform X2 [Tribolium madens]
MEAIYKNVIRADFLKVFQKQFKPKTRLFCNENYSQQEAIHRFLNEILITNFKSYVLEQSAYIIKKHHDQGNYTKEVEFSYNEFLSRSYNITKIFKQNMREASRELWRCDPSKHIKNETFVEITNFLHGFILNKANLDSLGQCREECDSFKMVKSKDCKKNNWCEKQVTCPKIIDCQYIDSSMTVCSSIMTKHNRRYEYIEFGNRITFGEKKICNGEITYLETYRNWLVWECSYCFCLCDEGPKYFSDRYINLRLSMSNISDNRVVTGLKFVKHNKIIHLQIQEGKLLEGGKIAPDSVQWVPPEDYKITDRYIHEGQDYHVITWEKRSMELTEIMAQNGSVVTGVRFKKIGTRLELEIMTTPFNFATGKLKQNPDKSSIFEEAPNIGLRHKFGNEIKLSSPDVPTRMTAPSNRFTTGKYIQFTNTDFYKDAAQTTVPFFDSQQVYSKHPVPLSGVGLFHKGRGGSGGFIAPKIFTYDFSQHL